MSLVEKSPVAELHGTMCCFVPVVLRNEKGSGFMFVLEASRSSYSVVSVWNVDDMHLYRCSFGQGFGIKVESQEESFQWIPHCWFWADFVGIEAGWRIYHEQTPAFCMTR